MWLRFCNLFYKQILQNRSQTSIFSLAPIFANFSLIKICKNWSHLKDWIFGVFSCLWFNDDKDITLSGPSLRTRIVIISRHVRSRGVDELKMLLLMPQKFNIPTLKIRCLLETWVRFSIVE